MTFSDYLKIFSCIFIDLMKAFDTLDHEILLDKLVNFGFREKSFSWLKSYLNDRFNKTLINNATSFIPKQNGKIEIGASKQNGKISFYVKDNGPGIPKDRQKLLFEKFFQLDSSHRREHQGLGLGLSICGKLVAGMNGKITVDSELGVGTTFTFDLNESVS